MDLSWIIRLIAQRALFVYILCAIGITWYLRKALATRREGSQALFSLERETAAKKVYRSSAMVFVLLLIAVGVYALTNHVEVPRPDTSPIEVPTSTSEAPTPTRVQSTSTPGTPMATAEPTATRRTSAPPVSQPTVAQPTPTQQVVPANCPHPNVQVTQPGQNQAINEGIQVRGTAQRQDFDRYEFKFQSRDFEDEWHWVETFRTPVENGDLGWWVTSHLPNGNYRFMLIAIDQRGNSQECIVPVVIKH